MLIPPPTLVTGGPSAHQGLGGSLALPEPRFSRSLQMSPWAVPTLRTILPRMVLYFAFTLFVSATLLFLVQPMVGKMILPYLGGTPAVWNTCMVFFQAVLLAGYAFAHASAAWMGSRRQAVLHIVLMTVPLLFLPIAVKTATVPTSQDNPVFWLLARLLAGVGMPFFIVSASAPLLQRWFSETRHAAAKDPYFLYAASNLGSLTALLGYPLIVEPLLPLDRQSSVWSIGYGLLIVLVAGCAILLWRAGPRRREGEAPAEPPPGFAPGSAGASPSPGCGARNTHPAPQSSVLSPQHSALSTQHSALHAMSDSHPAITVRRQLWWVFLAFVPSSLMLGVTAHITTDIAPVPLLWVVPLALYLLTFVMVFVRRPPLPHTAVKRILPFVIVPAALFTVHGHEQFKLLLIPLQLTAFFLAAMACHGRIAIDRPSAVHLTRYYLLMSVGGVLGGALNALVAPLIFDSIAEYPAVIVLACLALVRLDAARTRAGNRTLDVALPLCVGMLAAGFLYACWRAGLWDGLRVRLLTFTVLAALCLSLVRRPLRFALGLGAVLLGCVGASWAASDTLLYEGRNFYGVKRVKTDGLNQIHTLVHGNTVHGAQPTDREERRTPRIYYHPDGPLGDVMRAFNSRPTTRRVAVVGLGAGSAAAYAKFGQEFTFYEIDPEVARIARNPRLFTYLADCQGRCDVVLGDARLMLAGAPDAHFGLIVLDAFSSDAVPSHLLTREALQLYLAKLHPEGLLAFHISSQHFDLAPPLANLAADAGLVCLFRLDPAATMGAMETGRVASRYMVMTRRRDDLRGLEFDPKWKPVPTDPPAGVWTDQWTNPLRVIDWHRLAWQDGPPGPHHPSQVPASGVMPPQYQGTPPATARPPAATAGRSSTKAPPTAPSTQAGAHPPSPARSRTVGSAPRTQEPRRRPPGPPAPVAQARQ